MIYEIDENRLSGVKPNPVKVRIFRRVTIDKIKDFLKQNLKHPPTNIILYVGTNNSINESSNVILNKLSLLKYFIHTELPESNVILSNMIDRSETGIVWLKISNFNKHFNSLKIDIIDNGNISSENVNGSGLLLNRRGKGKWAIKLIKKLRELRRKKISRNWQQSGQCLARPQYYVLNCISNNDCKRKSDKAGPNHLLEIKHASSSAHFQNTGNQINTPDEIRIKNANKLIIGHLNLNSLWNKFEMLEEIIKDKIDIFLIFKKDLIFLFQVGNI